MIILRKVCLSSSSSFYLMCGCLPACVYGHHGRGVPGTHSGQESVRDPPEFKL